MKKNILNAISYVALIIVALLIFIAKVLPIIGVTVTGPLISILSTIQNGLVLLVIGICAFNFTINGKKWIKIVFWISIIVYVLGTIFIWL